MIHSFVVKMKDSRFKKKEIIPSRETTGEKSLCTFSKLSISIKTSYLLQPVIKNGIKST